MFVQVNPPQLRPLIKKRHNLNIRMRLLLSVKMKKGKSAGPADSGVKITFPFFLVEITGGPGIGYSWYSSAERSFKFIMESLKSFQMLRFDIIYHQQRFQLRLNQQQIHEIKRGFPETNSHIEKPVTFPSFANYEEKQKVFSKNRNLPYLNLGSVIGEYPRGVDRWRNLLFRLQALWRRSQSRRWRCRRSRTTWPATSTKWHSYMMIQTLTNLKTCKTCRLDDYLILLG